MDNSWSLQRGSHAKNTTSLRDPLPRPVASCTMLLSQSHLSMIHDWKPRSSQPLTCSVILGRSVKLNLNISICLKKSRGIIFLNSFKISHFKGMDGMGKMIGVTIYPSFLPILPGFLWVSNKTASMKLSWKVHSPTQKQESVIIHIVLSLEGWRQGTGWEPNSWKARNLNTKKRKLSLFKFFLEWHFLWSRPGTGILWNADMGPGKCSGGR